MQFQRKYITNYNNRKNYMKRKQIIILLIASALVCIYSCSCNSNIPAEDARDSSKNKTNVEHKESVTDSTSILRNNLKDLSEKIENVSSELSKVKENIEDINKNANDNRARSAWVVLICVLVGLLCILSLLFSLFKRLNGRADHHRAEIDSLKSKIEEYGSAQNNGTGMKRPNNTNSLSEKVQCLENEISKIRKEISMLVIPTTSSSSNSPAKITTKGYFGAAVKGENGSGYFKKVLESKDSDARFSAEIIDGSAKFEPIVPLSSVKSSDYFDLAVEFEGVSKAEAKDMSVHNKGLAKQRGDKWIIEKKAVITLK